MTAKLAVVLNLCLLLSICIFHNHALDANDLVITILSQENEYHLQLALDTKKLILKEAKALDKEPPVLYLSHIDFQFVGDWTIIPLIPKLEALHGSGKSWFVFIEDRTEIRLQKLLTTLNKYNTSEDAWVGYSLYDEEATIIHHFAFYQNSKSFKYPNIACGFAISINLLKKLAQRIRKHLPSSDFSIDSSHELATFIWQDGKGPPLIHDPAFCISDAENCCTIVKPSKVCDKPISMESLYFAVKTYSKFHNDRVPVVKKTWSVHASKIDFFSNLHDRDIPTIDLGIPNTESGHCGKTMAILKYAAEKLRNDNDIEWVILADDDTLFSVPRMQKFLSCYDSRTSMVLGERYGYNVLNPQGYNYITGGGGIIFSRKLVELLTRTGVCECPTISTPDDMFLGICISRIHGNIIHSSFFHQARPKDYSRDYLKTQMLISFHKHWMIDPFSVYQNWLADDDGDGVHKNNNHVEL